MKKEYDDSAKAEIAKIMSLGDFDLTTAIGIYERWNAPEQPIEVVRVGRRWEEAGRLTLTDQSGATEAMGGTPTFIESEIKGK